MENDKLNRLWETKEGKEIIAKMDINHIFDINTSEEQEEREEVYKRLIEFFKKIPDDMLFKFTRQCIKSKKFKERGYVLQQLVNEIGRRLEFKVENGPLRGNIGENDGYDGIWTTKDNYSIVIECKTTDVYSIKLEVLDAYRKKLIKIGKISEENSSILIVAGIETNGVIEQQIRGSKYAWDIRIITVESLIELLKFKKELNNNKTLQQIYEILKPKEYTNINELIKLIFYTVEDAKLGEKVQIEENGTTNTEKIYEQSLETIEKYKNIQFYKKLNHLYVSEDNKMAVIICYSKKYKQGKNMYYWFAYHPYYYENLQEYENKYIAYVCENKENIVLLPIEEIENRRKYLNYTKRQNDHKHWHIKISEKNGKFTLNVPKTQEKNVDITRYSIK